MTRPTPPAAHPPAAPSRPRLGAHAPGPLGGVVRGARKVAEALATPLVPSDYLDRLYRRGLVERISRGAYAWPDLDLGEN